MTENGPDNAPDNGPQTAPPAALDKDKEANQWALFLHLSQLANFLIPFAGLVAAIVIWQIKKDEMPSLDDHGRVVVNWQISLAIYGFVSLILTIVLIGVLLLVALVIVSVVFAVIGAIKGNNGELWPYPLSIPFLKLSAAGGH